jgi:hypothetical protein
VRQHICICRCTHYYPATAPSHGDTTSRWDVQTQPQLHPR